MQVYNYFLIKTEACFVFLSSSGRDAMGAGAQCPCAGGIPLFGYSLVAIWGLRAMGISEGPCAAVS